MPEPSPPSCPECGTAAVRVRKWNSGEPVDLWLEDCDCATEWLGARSAWRWAQR